MSSRITIQTANFLKFSVNCLRFSIKKKRARALTWSGAFECDRTALLERQTAMLAATVQTKRFLQRILTVGQFDSVYLNFWLAWFDCFWGEEREFVVRSISFKHFAWFHRGNCSLAREPKRLSETRQSLWETSFSKQVSCLWEFGKMMLTCRLVLLLSLLLLDTYLLWKAACRWAKGICLSRRSHRSETCPHRRRRRTRCAGMRSRPPSDWMRQTRVFVFDCCSDSVGRSADCRCRKTASDWPSSRRKSGAIPGLCSATRWWNKRHRIQLFALHTAVERPHRPNAWLDVLDYCGLLTREKIVS